MKRRDTHSFIPLSTRHLFVVIKLFFLLYFLLVRPVYYAFSVLLFFNVQFSCSACSDSRLPVSMSCSLLFKSRSKQFSQVSAFLVTNKSVLLFPSFSSLQLHFCSSNNTPLLLSRAYSRTACRSGGGYRNLTTLKRPLISLGVSIPTFDFKAKGHFYERKLEKLVPRSKYLYSGHIHVSHPWVCTVL